MSQQPDGDGIEDQLRDKLGGNVVGQLGEDSYDVMAAVGGFRGLVESSAPTVVFLVVYLTGQGLAASLISSLAVAAVILIVRIAMKQSVSPAIGGLFGVAIAAGWAWLSGRAENYFSWGLIVNAAWLVGTVISVLVRFPVVGAIVGLATNTWKTWRSSKYFSRFVWATILWAALFAARIAIQLPLLLEGEVAWLGTMRLIMGVPLFAVVGLVTWLLVRPAVREAKESAESPEESPSQ